MSYICNLVYVLTLKLDFHKSLFFLLFFVCFAPKSYALEGPKKNVKYKTYLGRCPTRPIANLTMLLANRFEDLKSLRLLKKFIREKRYLDKYFLKRYDISYDPMINMIKFDFDCPWPLMKVQVYKLDGTQSYSSILVDSGKLFDPTYETLLRAENKLANELPKLAIPIDKIDNKSQFKIGQIIQNLEKKYLKLISELILNHEGELTMILSIKQKPTSVFLGHSNWNKKVNQLKKILEYMISKNKIPSVVNLTGPKKVVVKFSDKI